MDHERDDLIEEMIKHQKLMRTICPKNTTSMMDHNNNDQNLFDLSQLGTSTSRHDLYDMQGNDHKRELPVSLYWDDQMGSIGSSSGRRFHHPQSDQTTGSTGTDGNSSSFVSMLSQLPQGINNTTTVPFSMGSPLLVGNIGDGVLRPPFQLSGGTWNS